MKASKLNEIEARKIPDFQTHTQVCRSNHEVKGITEGYREQVQQLSNRKSPNHKQNGVSIVAKSRIGIKEHKECKIVAP